jgi:hypothetical protein
MDEFSDKGKHPKFHAEKLNFENLLNQNKQTFIKTEGN